MAVDGAVLCRTIKKLLERRTGGFDQSQMLQSCSSPYRLTLLPCVRLTERWAAAALSLNASISLSPFRSHRLRNGGSIRRLTKDAQSERGLDSTLFTPPHLPVLHFPPFPHVFPALLERPSSTQCGQMTCVIIGTISLPCKSPEMPTNPSS
ncbi:unnamed protein product [Pleuronectes platessa]|uniref:Uncharacterized protein n=1 Tax=Pleuronectes platessa TaxID=8262 RepID=A0A9N7Z9M7_PLEPL|nr:unnamed protein product [Pleuronectes platessa]